LRAVGDTGDGSMGERRGMDMATGEGRLSERAGLLDCGVADEVEMERESFGLMAREASILTN